MNNIWDSISYNIRDNIWYSFSINMADEIWNNTWDNIADNIADNISDNIRENSFNYLKPSTKILNLIYSQIENQIYE